MHGCLGLFGVKGNSVRELGIISFSILLFPQWDSRVTDSEPLCRLLLCVSSKILQQELNLEY